MLDITTKYSKLEKEEQVFVLRVQIEAVELQYMLDRRASKSE